MHIFYFTRIIWLFRDNFAPTSSSCSRIVSSSGEIYDVEMASSTFRETFTCKISALRIHCDAERCKGSRDTSDGIYSRVCRLHGSWNAAVWWISWLQWVSSIPIPHSVGLLFECVVNVCSYYIWRMKNLGSPIKCVFPDRTKIRVYVCLSEIVYLLWSLIFDPVLRITQL